MPITFAPVQIYPSKKNIGLIASVYFLVLALVVLGWGNTSPFSIVFDVLMTAFFTHLFLSTKYTVKEDVLLVQSGFVFKSGIDISSIRKITETHSWWSAPALSPERMDIFYNQFDSVVISPQNKEVFIRHMQSINPDIVLEKGE